MQTSSIMIIMVLLASQLVVNGNSEKLDFEKCSRVNKFEDGITPIKKIARSPTRLMVRDPGAEMNVFYAKRERDTNYCYDGGALDPNTGCFKTKGTRYTFKKKEMDDMYTSRKCKIGCVCLPYSNCWGTDAKCCLSQAMIMETEGIAKFDVFSPWMAFAYHTCQSTWSCIMKEFKTQIYAHLGPEARYYLIDYDSNIVNVTTDNEQILDLKDGGQLYVKTFPSVKKKIVEGECFQNSNSTSICLLPNSERTGNLPIEIQHDTLTGSFRQIHITVLDNIEYIKDNNIYKSFIKEGGGVVVEEREVGASNIKNVRELETYIKVENLMLKNAVSQIEVILERIISLTGKVVEHVDKVSNGSLIPLLVGRGRVTHWINDELFTLCGVEREKNVNMFSNCNNGFTFVKNRWVDRKNSTYCFSIKPGLVHNISLFSYKTINVYDLQFLSPLLYEKDQRGWSTIAKELMIKNQVNWESKTNSNEDSIISQVYHYGSGLCDKVANYFHTLSSFVSWINLILTIKLMNR